MHSKRELDVEVALAGRPDERFRVAATIHLPAAVDARSCAIFALPGGDYGRGYFDIAHPGFSDYSQAAYHTTRGCIVVAIDPPGSGDSELPAGAAPITREDVAEAVDAAVRDIAGRLRAGRLDAALRALPNLLTVGIGQSMGGYLTICLQGRFRSYDAIGVLGFSAIHTVLPRKHPLTGEAGWARATGLHDLAQAIGEMTDWAYSWHWEDVPAKLIEADMLGGYPQRVTTPAWGSLTMWPEMMLGILPGAVAAEAAAIDVPVLIAGGARDVWDNPYAEPGAYRAAGDIFLHLLPSMAHMHNFASNRAKLWERLDHFVSFASRALGVF